MFTSDLPTIPKIHETTPETQIIRSVNLANTITTSSQFYNRYLKKDPIQKDPILVADVKCPETEIGKLTTGTYQKCRNVDVKTRDEINNGWIDILDVALEANIQKLTNEISHQDKFYYVDEYFDSQKEFVVYSVVVPQKNAQGELTVKYFQGYLKINTSRLSNQGKDPDLAKQSLEIHSILLRALEKELGLPQFYLKDDADILVEGGTVEINGQPKSFRLEYVQGRPILVFSVFN